MLLLKCLIASLPPFVVVQVYFYLVQEGAPVRVSPLLLKVVGFLAVFALANLGQAVIVRKAASTSFSYLLKINVLIWAFFFFFFTIDAFTLHRGLAKDAARSVTNILLEWAVDLGAFGIPLALVSSGLMHFGVRLRRGAKTVS